MIKIRITFAAVDAVNRSVGHDLVQQPRRTPEGDYVVEIPQRVMDAIRRRMFPGETVSDVIVRIFATKN